MVKTKIITVIIGWSVGMVGLTLAGVGAYTSNPALQWVGNSIGSYWGYNINCPIYI